MRPIPNLMILSGGASPHHESGKPGYDWIHNQARTRGVPYACLDYKGCGHYPEYGDGFDVKIASRAVLAEFRKKVSENQMPPGGVLFCRSLGCWVGAFLSSSAPDFAKHFTRIAFWGPPSYHGAWKEVAETTASLAAFNAKSQGRGLQLAARFWESLVPLEESARACLIPNVSIGFGTLDKLCGPAFVQYLGTICAGRDLEGGQVDIVCIEGADHEIPAEQQDGPIGKQYIDFIFSI